MNKRDRQINDLARMLEDKGYINCERNISENKMADLARTKIAIECLSFKNKSEFNIILDREINKYEELLKTTK